MGSYLNPGNLSFRGSLRSKIYVDKSELIAKTNEALCTEQKYICVSRPRRFGKSMAANMLAAYYDRSESTEELFQNLTISKERSYKENLNQYDVIHLDIQWFLANCDNVDNVVAFITKSVQAELREIYPGVLPEEEITFHEVQFRDEKNLIQVMKDVFRYLTYNSIDGTVAIPNKEVSQEYVNAISIMNWHGVIDSVESSRKLPESLWAMDADAVAEGIMNVS